MLFDTLERFLENQHPIVRSNLRLGAGIFAGMVALHTLVYAGLRWLDWRYLFGLGSALQLLQTLLLLLFVMMTYNALKTIWQYVRGEGVFTSISIILTVSAIVVTGFSLTHLPHVFTEAVSYGGQRPYDEIYQEFAQYCQRWEQEWQGITNITLDMETEDIGQLRGKAEVYRLNNIIFFNFSPTDQPDIGFACALNGNTPPTYGRANDYQYTQLEGIKYRFIERVGRGDQ